MHFLCVLYNKIKKTLSKINDLKIHFSSGKEDIHIIFRKYSIVCGQESMGNGWRMELQQIKSCFRKEWMISVMETTMVLLRNNVCFLSFTICWRYFWELFWYKFILDEFLSCLRWQNLKEQAQSSLTQTGITIELSSDEINSIGCCCQFVFYF